MSDGDLIRTGEAASILGSSRQHVVDLCEQGLLTCVRSPTQRRVRRSEVEALVGRRGHRPRLNRDQRQSLWLHGAVAGRLAADPATVLAHAEANLDRLRATHPSGMSARWIERWRSVLDAGPEAVLETLTSPTSTAVELRQNSPFAGVLPTDARLDVLRAFREQDRASTS